MMKNWGERGITAKQLNVKKGDVIKVVERYPIGLWLGEMNGERGIFDSKCTVACNAEGESCSLLSSSFSYSFS